MLRSAPYDYIMIGVGVRLDPARRQRRLDGLHAGRVSPGRPGRDQVTFPTTHLQPQPLLRGPVPHTEVPTRLPRPVRIDRRCPSERPTDPSSRHRYLPARRSLSLNFVLSLAVRCLGRPCDHGLGRRSRTTLRLTSVDPAAQDFRRRAGIPDEPRGPARTCPSRRRLPIGGPWSNDNHVAKCGRPTAFVQGCPLRERGTDRDAQRCLFPRRDGAGAVDPRPGALSARRWSVRTSSGSGPATRGWALW
jgi:hypothetical protein